MRIVITDNIGTFPADLADHVAHLRDHASGFCSVLLPYRSGTDCSVRLGPRSPDASTDD